jgi:hypothetical protein
LPKFQPSRSAGAVVAVRSELDDEALKINESEGCAVDGTVPTTPDDALTVGTLNEGALDHGFVAAVAVTVWTLESVTMPEVRNVPPLIWTSPDDAETMGRLKPGAEDHGFVAAVAVTVWTLLSVMVPDEMAMALDRLTTVEPAPEPATMVTSTPPEVVTVAAPPEEPTIWICVEPEPDPARMVTPKPPDVVTGAIPDDVPTRLKKGVLESVKVPLVTDTSPDVIVVGPVAVTVGTLENMIVPLEIPIADVRETAVVGLVTVTDVEGLVIVTAVLGLETAISRPPVLVTSAMSVDANAPSVSTSRCNVAALDETAGVTVSRSLPVESPGSWMKGIYRLRRGSVW